MKALLVNPWICDFAAYDLWLRPFGLLRAGTVLRRWGWEVELLDCLDRFDPELKDYPGLLLPRRDRDGRGKFPRTPVGKPEAIAEVERPYFRYGLPLELARRRLEERGRPDLILAGTTMTYWYPGYFEALELVRKVFPSVPTVLGGLYPRLCPDHARTFSGADIVLTGGGWGELAAAIDGLGFPPPPPDGDEIIPAYDLLRDRSALAVRTGRGCPHSCSYCAAALLEPELLRRTPESAATEIAGYRDRYGSTDIAFYDNALLFDSPNHLDRILSLLLRRGIRGRFHTPNGLHARFLTARTAGLMKESGFIQPRLGLESSRAEVQQRTGGKVANRDFIRALDRLEAAGFSLPEIIVYLMIGLPGQSPGEAEADIRFVHSLGATVSLAAYSPIPGTADYLALVRKGEIPPDLDPLWQNNTIFCPRQGVFTLEVVRGLRQLAGELNRKLPGAGTEC
jgi:hypothetical protein